MFQGYYINLKKDKRRKKDLLSHFKKLGINNYKRYDAIVGSDVKKQFNSPLSAGELGCSFSHLNLIKENIFRDVHIHIIEDDVILHKDLANIFESLNNKLEWDIIYTDVYFSFLDPVKFFSIYQKYQQFKNTGELSLINLQTLSFSATSSYFINKNSLQKVYNLLNNQEYLKVVNSEYINKLVQSGALKAYAMMPFFSTLSQNSEKSTIDENYTTTMFAMDSLRKSLYVDADQQLLQKAMSKKKNSMSISSHVNIYADSNKIVLDNLDKNLDVVYSNN